MKIALEEQCTLRVFNLASQTLDWTIKGLSQILVLWQSLHQQYKLLPATSILQYTDLMTKNRKWLELHSAYVVCWDYNGTTNNFFSFVIGFPCMFCLGFSLNKSLMISCNSVSPGNTKRGNRPDLQLLNLFYGGDFATWLATVLCIEAPLVWPGLMIQEMHDAIQFSHIVLHRCSWRKSQL